VNEAETCRRLVRPRLETAGWDASRQHFYSEQIPFTDGRIVTPGGKPIRLKKKIADFLLRYTRDITLGVVEAESDRRPAGDGLQQAKDMPRSSASCSRLPPTAESDFAPDSDQPGKVPEPPRPSWIVRLFPSWLPDVDNVAAKKSSQE
jgi:hypothetical protein